MFKTLIKQLLSLRQLMLNHEASMATWLSGVSPGYAASARNLAHYLALRQRDCRPLQQQLDALGVSSLGRAEPHVLEKLDQVIAILHRLEGNVGVQPGKGQEGCLHGSHNWLEQHTTALLGPAPLERSVRIMVTLPTEAAKDFGLVRQLMDSGMNIARINCAHDDASDWQAMAVNVRRAAKAMDQPVRILMDLAGPKLRTGPIASPPAVLKLRPQRDAFGRVLSNALLGLRPAGSSLPVAGAPVCLGGNPQWLAQLEAGDELDFKDAAGTQRSLKVIRRDEVGVLTESEKTARLLPQTRLKRRRKGRGLRTTLLFDLPCKEGLLHLMRGSVLHLTLDGIGCNADPHHAWASVACTLPQVFEQVRVGERIWFDDGRIGGVIRRIEPQWLELEITHARDAGEKLAADKGINLPDSLLDLPALTDKDIEDLPVVARLADLVGLSFVQQAQDVQALREHLLELDATEMGLMLKIETRRGFENLPELLFSAMANKAAGVMIARGDLAVECGYERLAEVQEEILCAAEAAHMPVIWATQVLETMVKTGLPTRAEISDAAMGERAECVMLNKGPYIMEAMFTLNDILHRMQTHQTKKRPLLRQLHAWLPRLEVQLPT
ncbi:MAG: pyruvate kinase [Comamonadaceae bacterium]|nr:MAG: pyruvate kinase [Comamonadaceae bacterium]